MKGITLIALVITKIKNVLVKTLESLQVLFMLEILLEMVKNTRGTTNVNIRLTKISPRGEIVSTNVLEANIPTKVALIRATIIEKTNQYFFNIFNIIT